MAKIIWGVQVFQIIDNQSHTILDLYSVIFYFTYDSQDWCSKTQAYKWQAWFKCTCSPINSCYMAAPNMESSACYVKTARHNIQTITIITAKKYAMVSKLSSNALSQQLSKLLATMLLFIRKYTMGWSRHLLQTIYKTPEITRYQTLEVFLPIKEVYISEELYRTGTACKAYA